MNFSFLKALRNVIRPIQAVESDVTNLEHALFNTERNKPYWLNKNAINQASIAKIHDLHALGVHSYSTNTWYYGDSKLFEGELKTSLSNVFKTKKVSEVTLDITDVTGISASKSPIEDYMSMDDFVENACRKYFEITEDDLRKNLGHKEIRILHSEKTSDYLKMYGWSDKLFLCNSGGSHHFVSARYIAKRLSKEVPVTGKMELNYIDKQSFQKYLTQFSSVLIPFSDFCYLQQKLENSGLNLFFLKSAILPAETIILFYKCQDIPEEIDSLFKYCFTDFNKELIKFNSFQNTNILFQKYLSLDSLERE